MRKVVAGTLAAASVALGGIALASPAWAATCSLGANQPNSSVDGLGGRYNCSGTTSLSVRVAKDVWGTDPYFSTYRSSFTNGDLWAYGDCSKGAGSYYTWTVSGTGNSIESGRVGRC